MPWWNRRPEVWLTPLVAILFLGLWIAVVYLGDYPAFILPGPDRVWQRFWGLLTDGTLLRHTWVTLQEVLGGLLVGIATATALGYLLGKSHLVERLLAPYIVASQAVPMVALAPLLVIWFGPGLLSKVLVCALVIFFPMLVNTMVGIRSVEPELMDLMRSLEASRWQVFTKLEVPAALPVLLGGLKVGATLSVIGAVVGEFVAADQGLGFLVRLGQGLFDTPLIFVAIAALIAIALTLYGGTAWLERRLLRWQVRREPWRM